MAREHHCPNCGAQACNASTSKIHTCGVCAAIWEEDLSVAAPAAPRPAAPVTPSVSAATPAAKLAPPKAPSSPSPSAAAPKPTAPSAAGPKPVATAATPPAANPTAPPPAPKPTASAASGGGKTLAEVVAAAKVKRCPACKSDGVAQPADFRTVGGRVVLADSQTYRGHEWYADTGELLPSAPTPKPAAAGPAPTTAPAT